MDAVSAACRLYRLSECVVLSIWTEIARKAVCMDAVSAWRNLYGRSLSVKQYARNQRSRNVVFMNVVNE